MINWKESRCENELNFVRENENVDEEDFSTRNQLRVLLSFSRLAGNLWQIM